MEELKLINQNCYCVKILVYPFCNNSVAAKQWKPMSSLKIFLPSFSSEQTVYFRGHVYKLQENKCEVYVTHYSVHQGYVQRSNDNKNIIYGSCGGHQTRINQKHWNYVNIDMECKQSIQRLILEGVEVDCPVNCVIMLYDYKKIRDSQIIPNPNDCDGKFLILQSLILKDFYGDTDGSRDIPIPCNIKPPTWLSTSLFIQHLYSYINLLNWLKANIYKDRKVQLKQANLMFAIAIDLILGYFLLKLLMQDKEELGTLLMAVLEKLINSLYSLLKWLMGAPAGLKLNNAFNKMLGKYFSYHVQLWWLFLDVSGEKLHIVLNIYQYLGYLGLTFQAAMLCDLMCLATFHSYCIYVYAARLYNIQTSGLIALLRLFVGRKYNPLRGGVDSCEYSNQQLFVGTVAFTILLLLFPTTAMYYTVFTLFRLLSLSVQNVLVKIIYYIQTVPLYVTILWAVRSPKVAGNIFIEVLSTKEDDTLILKVELLPMSLLHLLANYKPPTEILNHMKQSNLLSNMSTGKQIS